MTRAKSKIDRDSIEGYLFARFNIRETPDTLIISEPPRPFLSGFMTAIFGVPAACMGCFVMVFALRDGGAALIAAFIFIPIILFTIGSIALRGVNTSIIMVTRDAIWITQQPIRLSKHQIPLEGLQGFEIQEYIEYEDGEKETYYQLFTVPRALYKKPLFDLPSKDDINRLKLRLENFLGL